MLETYDFYYWSMTNNLLFKKKDFYNLSTQCMGIDVMARAENNKSKTTKIPTIDNRYRLFGTEKFQRNTDCSWGLPMTVVGGVTHGSGSSEISSIAMSPWYPLSSRIVASKTIFGAIKRKS